MSAYGGRGPTVNAALWVQTFLAGALVAMRVYTRVRILHSFGWDDLMLIITWLLLAIYAALITVATTYGLGRRRAEISPEDYVQAQKYETIGQAVCIFNIIFSKCAVAFFLLRIVFKRWHKALIWCCIVTTTLLTTWGTIAIFIQCTPVEKVWNFQGVDGVCWLDFAKIGLVVSAYAVCMDFILALAPCFIVWELNMKKKDKLLTISALSLGVFAGVCGILRTTALTSLRSFEEYIFDTCNMLIYSGTENFVSVLCASIPVLRPLWSKVRHGYYGSDGQSGDRSYEMGRYARSGRSDGKDRETPLKMRPDHSVLETTIYTGTNYDTKGDNASEETILRETNEQQGKGEVHYRTEVSVQYSNAGESLPRRSH